MRCGDWLAGGMEKGKGEVRFDLCGGGGGGELEGFVVGFGEEGGAVEEMSWGRGDVVEEGPTMGEC